MNMMFRLRLLLGIIEEPMCNAVNVARHIRDIDTLVISLMFGKHASVNIWCNITSVSLLRSMCLCVCVCVARITRASISSNLVKKRRRENLGIPR